MLHVAVAGNGAASPRSGRSLRHPPAHLEADIAPACGTARASPSRFLSLKAFGRRPRCKPHRRHGPASETLNIRRHGETAYSITPSAPAQTGGIANTHGFTGIQQHASLRAVARVHSGNVRLVASHPQNSRIIISDAPSDLRAVPERYRYDCVRQLAQTQS